MTQSVTSESESATPYVRPDVQGFLAFIESQARPPADQIPIEARRAMARASTPVADVPVGELGRVEDIEIPGPAGPITARIFDAQAERTVPGPVMVFFHGGGFVMCDIDTHAPFCGEAARQLDMPVISIDYRLAPEHPYPAPTDDCEAATRWIAEHFPASGMILCGDSAGGNLTIVTAMALAREPAAKPVIAQMPFYPAVTHRKQKWASYDRFCEGYFLTADAMRYFTQCYAADDESWRSSPIEYDLSAMPPAVVMTAGLDPLRDQGRLYAAKLIDSGIRTTYLEAEGNIHGFINMRQAIPSTQKDMDAAFNALKLILADHIA